MTGQRQADHGRMSVTDGDSAALTRAECLALLPTAPFGRLVFTEGALPAVIPVNFVLDPAGIVIRTAADTAVARLAPGTVVAVQADQVDPLRRVGWSVTVVGQARTAVNPVEVDRLAALPLVPWVPGDRSTFVVVGIGIVTGRRIGGPSVVADHAHLRG